MVSNRKPLTALTSRLQGLSWTGAVEQCDELDDHRGPVCSLSDFGRSGNAAEFISRGMTPRRCERRIMSAWNPKAISKVPAGNYLVVHPLDDEAEEKVDISKLGRMPMTKATKLSLLVLRGYLILMVLLVLYHVVGLAGIFPRNGH
jgi:hypothetical protein